MELKVDKSFRFAHKIWITVWAAKLYESPVSGIGGNVGFAPTTASDHCLNKFAPDARQENECEFV